MRRSVIVAMIAMGLCARADSPENRNEASAGEAQRARCAPIGTNLSMPAYWTRSYPFVDIMKASFPFMSSGPGVWTDDRPIEVDDHGWPQALASDQVARTMLLHGETGHPTGRMTVLYDGKGRIQYHGNVRNLKRSPGRDTFDLGPGGLYIDITHLDPDDRLRNVRVLMPGGRCGQDVFSFCMDDDDCGHDRCVPFEETYEDQPFHPRFLQEVRPFRALRFMDWMLTNREVAQEDGVEEPHPIRELSEYPTPEHMSWRPVPIDVLVDLANLLGKDAWFNVPHTASDDFVRGMAQRVAARLRPDLKAYVEYSNETWNEIFDQHHWVNARGCRALSKDPRRECGDGGATLCGPKTHGRAKQRCTRYGQRWFGRRTVEIGRMWRQAFAAKDPGRVTVVLGVQVNGGWWYERVLRERLPGGDPVHRHVDAVATAPYFGLSEADSVDEVFARTKEPNRYPPGTYRLLAGSPEDSHGGVLGWIREDAQVLHKKDLRHLQLVAYEAGQGLQHYDPKVSEVFSAANRDPRMRDVYRQYLDHWARLSNGGLLMHFSSSAAYTDHGAWGMKEAQDQPRHKAPKYDALLNYIERHRGCSNPHRAATSPDRRRRPPSPDEPD